MKTDEVIVKKSFIQGKGIFALRDFKMGEIVTHWDTSKELSEEEFEKLSDEEREYVSFFQGKYVLMQEPERYQNHSCQANTTVKDFCDVAVRDIRKGEEITGNYEEVLPGGMEMECSCKSRDCRKIIRPKKQLK
ncbi:MAG: SET domain-containing protein [Candidatus Aenigmarchaeota archaeon]|nr:SET domain-containing protein [Candidatus Aenigmarchaeota archaeon]